MTPGYDDAPVAALATGAGAAAIAVLRLSGRGCHAHLQHVIGAPLASWGERRLTLTQVVDPATREVVDDAMVVLFRGPRSYTGEDSAEIHAHGGPYVVQRLLSVLYANGFRPAEPGELTRRAFLNGKLDLTAAEGIKELVEAQSHQQWLAARHLASGHLRESIHALRQTLVEALAYLEAQIDFPDEGDTASLHLGHVATRVAAAAAQIQRLIGSYGNGRVAAEGLRVALFGAPNAGKSTLLNTLLGRERAIVTPIAGTTRDWLEEPCLIEGRLLRLVDMAGMRDNPDPVEALGIDAARRLAREADLVLFLAEAGPGAATPEERIDAWTIELQPRSQIKIATKADLGRPPWTKDWLRVSCKTGEGLPELRHRLVVSVDAHVGDLTAEPAFVTTARQLAALQDAAAALSSYANAAAAGAYEELLAFELQQAARALKGLIGDVGVEDVLDKVFSEFCVGK